MLHILQALSRSLALGIRLVFPRALPLQKDVECPLFNVTLWFPSALRIVKSTPVPLELQQTEAVEWPKVFLLLFIHCYQSPAQDAS